MLEIARLLAEVLIVLLTAPAEMFAYSFCRASLLVLSLILFVIPIGASSSRISSDKHSPQLKNGPAAEPMKVAIIGSGNWGTAVARRVSLNINGSCGETFAGDVHMWVYEEIIDGRKLTEIINSKHENPKYLPGIQLPPSVVACADIIETCKDADLLLFVVPHQFLRGVLDKLRGNIKPHAIGVSLIKGLDVGPEGPQLLSEMIKDQLQLTREVAVVMGANVASEVAKDQFVECTVACPDAEVANLVAQLFHCHCMRTDTCSDVATVEICGALKNVVAMGGGFCDALGMGSSTKAAVLRRGLSEIAEFCQIFSGDSFEVSTMLQSCGVADVIASSYGGRNRRCAQEFAEYRLKDKEDEEGGKGDAPSVAAGAVQEEVNTIPIPGTAGGAAADPVTVSATIGTSPAIGKDTKEKDAKEGVLGRSDEEYLRNLWGDIEQRLLNGQKLQGLGTCDELMLCLRAKNLITDDDLYGSSGTGRGSGRGSRSEGEQEEKPSTKEGADSNVHTHMQEHESLSSSPSTVEKATTATQEEELNNNIKDGGEFERSRHRFGLFKRIHAIARLGESPRTLFDW